MRHFLTAVLILGASVVVPLPGFAQDSASTPGKSKNRPFKSADSGDEKAAVGVEVVPRSQDPTLLKEWKLNKAGSTAMGVTVYVTEVQLFSSGIMRWNLSFWNRSNEGQMIYFDFEDMIIADDQSNPYTQVGRQIMGGNGNSIHRRSIPRDQRFNTWVDYKCPEEPQTSFKIGVMLEARYDHRADAFKPFQVVLNEPLYLKDGVFEPKKAAPAPPPYVPGSFGGERDGNGSGHGLAGPISVEPIHICPSPKQFEEREQKFRDLSEEGRRIDGNLSLSQGLVHEQGRIIFKKRERGDFVEATIVSLTGTPRTFELYGAFFEDLRSPTGLVLKMRDNAKVLYTFKLDANCLSGTDTLGNRYTFTIPAKK